MSGSGSQKSSSKPNPPPKQAPPPVPKQVLKQTAPRQQSPPPKQATLRQQSPPPKAAPRQYIVPTNGVDLHPSTELMMAEKVAGGGGGEVLSYDVYVGEKRDFDTIRKEFLAKPGGVTLYEDPEFPAIETSLYFSRHPTRPIEWLRPPVRVRLVSV